MLQEVGTALLAVPVSPYTAAYNIIDSCTKSDELWDFMAPFVAQSGVHVSELVQRHTEKIGHQRPSMQNETSGHRTANAVKGHVKAPRYQSLKAIRAVEDSGRRESRRFRARERIRLARHWFNVGVDVLVDV